MLFNALRTRLQQREEGFTLIELLVVVIIIGILAAIAIPTFLNQRERGWEASAQADIRNAATALESHAVSANGSYAAANGDLTVLEAEGWNNTTDVTVTVASDADSYCVTANHGSGGDFFRLDSNVGEMERATTAAGLTACS